MPPEGSIAVPSASNVMSSLQDYGMGAVAGVGYRIVSQVVGSSMIGGAIAAALTGAVIKGPAGKIIAVQLGFVAGQQLLAGGGLGSLPIIGNLFGGGGGGGPNQAPEVEVL